MKKERKHFVPRSLTVWAACQLCADYHGFGEETQWQQVEFISPTSHRGSPLWGTTDRLRRDARCLRWAQLIIRYCRETEAEGSSFCSQRASSTVRGANLWRETSPQPQIRCVEMPGQVMALEPGMTREDFLNKVFQAGLSQQRQESMCVRV